MDRQFKSKPFYYRLTGEYALFKIRSQKGEERNLPIQSLHIRL